MNITVLKSGYVWFLSETCFVEMGNSISCVDTDSNWFEYHEIRKSR